MDNICYQFLQHIRLNDITKLRKHVLVILPFTYGFYVLKFSYLTFEIPTSTGFCAKSHEILAETFFSHTDAKQEEIDRK